MKRNRIVVRQLAHEEAAGGKGRVGGRVGELLALDDVAHLIADDVGLDGRDGVGFFEQARGKTMGQPKKDLKNFPAK